MTTRPQPRCICFSSAGHVVARHERMLDAAAAAVAEDDDRVGVVQRLLVLRPAVGVDLDDHVPDVQRGVEAVPEQDHAFFVFMFAGGVALLAGQQDHFGVLGQLRRQAIQREGRSTPHLRAATHESSGDPQRCEVGVRTAPACGLRMAGSVHVSVPRVAGDAISGFYGNIS